MPAHRPCPQLAQARYQARARACATRGIAPARSLRQPAPARTARVNVRVPCARVGMGEAGGGIIGGAPSLSHNKISISL